MKSITVNIKGIEVTAFYNADSAMPITEAKNALVIAAKAMKIKGAWSAVAILEIK